LLNFFHHKVQLIWSIFDLIDFIVASQTTCTGAPHFFSSLNRWLSTKCFKRSGGKVNANIEWWVFRSKKKESGESVKINAKVLYVGMKNVWEAWCARETPKSPFLEQLILTPQVTSLIISITNQDCECLPFSLKPLKNVLL